MDQTDTVVHMNLNGDLLNVAFDVLNQFDGFLVLPLGHLRLRQQVHNIHIHLFILFSRSVKPSEGKGEGITALLKKDIK
jgi:hypothetical protein